MAEQPTPTLSDTVAARIRAQRRRLGVSIADLARACQGHGRPDLTHAALTNIESGRPNPNTGIRRREITIDELAIIEKALGVRLLGISPPCETCSDQPHPGFTCRTCGAEA